MFLMKVPDSSPLVYLRTCHTWKWGNLGKGVPLPLWANQSFHTISLFLLIKFIYYM